MKQLSTSLLLIFIVFAQFALAQEKVDEQIIAKIKTIIMLMLKLIAPLLSTVTPLFIILDDSRI